MTASSISPRTGASFDRLEQMRHMSSLPIRQELGLRSVIIDHDRVVEEMDIAPWLRDQHGEVATGALGLLVDAVLGRSVMVAVADDISMATSHLHMELLRPIPRDTTMITCTGVPRAVDGTFGLSEGEVVTDAGVVVARASLGAILIEARTVRSAITAVADTTPERSENGEVASHQRPHRLLAGSPVHATLGTRVVSARRSGVRLTNPAAPRWSNLSKGVFGGIGVLMGERAMDVALRAALDPSVAMRPVELRAAYVRPIPADGSLIECHAQVMYLGRRLAVVRGEVRAPDGRVAVLVDASYVPMSS
ncbi:MAG: hypothetical protein JWL70_2759 [Acidimicrobiia bacterium]|nr:hypothetical protein [Acidimicrobiia bacterium]